MLFRNCYRCPTCGGEWTDVWPAQCDDDCPLCGARHISPYKSEDAATLPGKPLSQRRPGVRTSAPGLFHLPKQKGRPEVTLPASRERELPNDLQFAALESERGASLFPASRRESAPFPVLCSPGPPWKPACWPVPQPVPGLFFHPRPTWPFAMRASVIETVVTCG
jgi:hypothetical protein